MKNISILQEIFSDQALAKENDGIISEIIIHLLKLEFQFDYERDHDKHISDIASWAKTIIDKRIKDKSSRSAIRIVNYYLRDRDEYKEIMKLKKYFAEHYERVNITIRTYNMAITRLTQILDLKKRSEVVSYLNNEYPL